MPGPFYFSWADAGEAFDPDIHNTFDQQILGAEIAHAEGEAAVLSIRIKNPGVGALTIGRWAWFSYDDGGSGGIVPLFNGRLIGSPADLQNETVTLQLRAIPDDYIDQKKALSESMRVLPYWDPVWLVEKIDDPDTVLESYCAVWHVDRVTLGVTAAHLLDGEDGTLDIADHLYASLKASFGSTPKRKIKVTGNVNWKQTGAGDVDLTTPLWEAFRAAGSPFAWPQVGSFTSAGLLQDWPAPLTSLGGGWSISAGPVIDPANFAQGWNYVKAWTNMSDVSQDELRTDGWRAQIYHAGWVTWAATFQVLPLLQHLAVHYEADRDRSETISFMLEADIQPQAIDLDGDDEEELTLSSEYVDQAVEEDGSLPIADTRKNAYFAGDRGNLSAQSLMLIAAAKMLFSARSVEIEFQLAGWPAVALALSCRKSVLLHDRRLPGGQALGKITSYKLSVAGGAMRTTVVMGCAVGYGVTLPGPADGTDVYALNYASGYTRRSGSQVEVIPGTLVYDEFGGTVIDDDGVDLFNQNAASVLLSPVAVVNGSNDQQAVIDAEAALIGVSPDPIEALRNAPTTFTIELVPVTGGAFHTDYAVTMEKLVVPKMIDLEAA
jgi:hypothetical protein